MRLIGIGAGGHARVMIEILQQDRRWQWIGLLDAKQERWGRSVQGVEVLGSDELLPRLRQQGVRRAFIGVGNVGPGQRRQAIDRLLQQFGYQVVSVIHPSAVISPSVRFEDGLCAMAQAVVNAGSRLGRNCIVNTQAIVEHDCELDNHVHISSGACLAGGVRVGACAFVGARATVLQGVTIGPNAVVGAGAVVTKDVAPAEVVVGVPAKPLRKKGNCYVRSEEVFGVA